MKLFLVASGNANYPGIEIEAVTDAEAAVLAAYVSDQVQIEPKAGASVTFDAANLFAQMPIAKS
jgi:hypothetical protein